MKRAIGLIFAVIAVVVAFLSMRGTMPFMPIYGSSMEPTLHSGSLMMITPINNPQNIKVGDIIVYTVPDMVRQYYNYPQIGSPQSYQDNDHSLHSASVPRVITPAKTRLPSCRIMSAARSVSKSPTSACRYSSSRANRAHICHHRLALLALFLYGREIGRGGSWIQKGIFSPVIKEEKRANRMLSKKIEAPKRRWIPRNRLCCSSPRPYRNTPNTWPAIPALSRAFPKPPTN